MARGLLPISANFERRIAAPIDDMRVQLKSDLLLPASWTADDNVVYTWLGMFALVYGDTVNNGGYLLIASDYTLEASWLQIGSSVDLSDYVTSASLFRNGLIKSELLPDINSDVIELLEITAYIGEVVYMVDGDQVFDTSDKKIYTYTAEVWSNPTTPEANKLYLCKADTLTYKWNGTTLVTTTSPLPYASAALTVIGTSTSLVTTPYGVFTAFKYWLANTIFSSLTTGAKNIIGAINEIVTNFQKKTDNSLETTSKQIVGAINEVNIKANNPSGFSIYNSDTDAFASMTLSSGWSLSNNKLSVSSNGGTTCTALFNTSSVIDRSSIFALVTITDITSVFSIIKKPSNNLLGGSIFKVNLINNRIEMYYSWDGTSTLPSITKYAVIPFSIISGRTYIIEVSSDRNIDTFTLTDSLEVSNKISISNNQITELLTGSGKFWDAPGIMFISGSISINKFCYNSLFNKKINVLIAGHSFVEGLSLYSNEFSNLSYSNLIYNKIPTSVAISGRGGAQASHLLATKDLDYFDYKYAIIDIGANDTVYATWLSNVQAIIAKILSKGATPILATITPRDDRQTFINSANAWIYSSGYKYVDSAKILTINNDGITRNPDYFYSDGVHPNLMGHQIIYNSIIFNFPELINNYSYEIVPISKIASFTLSVSDRFIIVNSSSAVSITIPKSSIFFSCDIINIGTGVVSFVAASGVTIKSPESRLKIRTTNSSASISCYSSDAYLLSGDLIL